MSCYEQVMADVKPATRPITVNAFVGGSDPMDVRSGAVILPIERLKLFSPSEWEDFVNEWASSLGSYGLVERTGGSGDMGCDVIGTIDPNVSDGPWDNYQCKHYDHPLAPADIWIEIGKLVYFTFKNAYGLPRRYYFIAPRGVGTKLSGLLKRPHELKVELLAQWQGKCAKALIDGKTTDLDVALRAHIESRIVRKLELETGGGIS